MDNEIIIPGYSIFRQDRDSHGGGIFLIVHDSIPARRISPPTPLEAIAIEILTPRPVVICLVYLPPGLDPNTLTSTISFLSPFIHDHQTILLGDFNLPDINWDNLSCSSPSSNLFCEFVFDHDLLQFIRETTHSKGNILDLVLSKSPDLINDVTILSSEPFPNLKSDHKLISFSIPCSLTKNNKSKPHLSTFNFRKGSYDLMNDYIGLCDFTYFYNSNNIEFLWSSLKSLILESIHLFVPKGLGLGLGAQFTWQWVVLPSSLGRCGLVL